MYISNEILIDEDNNKFYAQYTMDGQRYYVSENEYFHGLEKEVEQKNEELQKLDEDYNKKNNKRRLYFASLITICTLGGVVSTCSQDKIFNINPFSSTKEQKNVITSYEDSLGNDYSTTTAVGKESIIAKNEEGYLNKTLFTIYEGWKKDGDKYYRTVRRYSVKNESVEDLLNSKDVNEITEEDLINLGFKEEYSNTIEASSLSEEELNEEPYLSIITKVNGETVELKKGLGDRLSDIALNGLFFVLGFSLTFVIEAFVVFSSKKLRSFDSNIVDNVNSIANSYNKVLKERNIINDYLENNKSRS